MSPERLVQTRLILLAASVTVVLTSSATAQPTAYSRDWVRAHSPHFTAAGNATFQQMHSVLLELEGFRGALLRSLPGLRAASSRPVTVIVFRDARAFAPFTPAGATGERRENVVAYFLTTKDESYMVVAMHRDMRRTFQYLFHEYTHFIVHANLGRVPGWLNEGLAEYYSTLRADLESRRAILGEPPQVRLTTLASGRLLPLADVLAFNSSGTVTQPPERTAAFYAQSWALVHYLQHGEGGRLAAGVARYLESVNTGASIAEAVPSAFGLSLQDLESRLLAYIRRGSHATRTIAEPDGAEPIRVKREALREADVTSLLERIAQGVTVIPDWSG